MINHTDVGDPLTAHLGPVPGQGFYYLYHPLVQTLVQTFVVLRPQHLMRFSHVVLTTIGCIAMKCLQTFM